MIGTVLTYKGYSALVDHSAEDGCLVGRVLGIGDIIDCEGATMDEVEQDFRNAIDSYLDACATWGKKPDAPDAAGLRPDPAAAPARPRHGGKRTESVGS